MFRYPYTNFHEMNLDWIIRKLMSGEFSDCEFVKPEKFPDSFNPVQDALDAAVNENKIVLLTGEYMIRETLQPAEGTRILGLFGAKLISVAQDGTVGFAPTTLINCPSDFMISNVILDGNRPDGPSQSTYPSAPGNETETVLMAPLISVYNADQVTFHNCHWINYDSNRSTSLGSYRYAALGCYSSTNVHVINCSFQNILRECIVFQSCQWTEVNGCQFDTGDEAGIYSEIGILQSNHIAVKNCRIVHGATITSSVINAMGDHIEICGCNITATASTYGIDYGNEIESGFTADDLYIHDNTLNCRISAHTSAQDNLIASHDHVVIQDNTFLLEGLSGSGIIFIYNYNGEQMIIQGNKFLGVSTSNTRGISFDVGYSAKVDVLDNYFEIRAFWFRGTCKDLSVRNNHFVGTMFYQDRVGDEAEELSIVGCRTDTTLGSAVENNNISLVFIGCDLYSRGITHTTIDTTLSHVR